jgi:putative membrane protein
MEGEVERIFILCVDRDDDISVKCRVKTPILGDKNVREAALKLIMEDPEESDANALFGALKTYGEVKKETDCEVALIAGSRKGGLDADRKLLKELDAVLTSYPANKAIIISDGYSDEVAIPVIQSRIPIISVKRVVVRHSEAIEASWALLYRYAKKVVEDPLYSRYLLGLPGIVIVALAVLSMFQMLHYGWMMLGVFFGLVLLVKGFRIDLTFGKAVRNLKGFMETPHGQLRVYTTIASAVLSMVGVYRAVSFISVNRVLEPKPEVVSLIVADFIEQAMLLIILAVCVGLGGIMVYDYFTRDPKFWRSVVGIVFSVSVYPVLHEIAMTIKLPARAPIWLLYSIIAGIILIMATVVLVHVLRKEFAHYFKE